MFSIREMAYPFIYLNNAATSWPKPPEVAEAVRQAVAMPAADSGRSAGGAGYIDYVSEARADTARFFGAENPDHIIFTASATDSLNILIAGFIKNHPGTRIITTALDHNSVLRPLSEYERMKNITMDILPFSDGMVSAESVEAAITHSTSCMVMTHASNVLGSVQKIKEIGDILHAHDIFFIVDGAQSAGYIPVSLHPLPVDAFVFTGHKGIPGLAGTGGFYLREPHAIAPTRFGGTGTESRLLYQPGEMPERFESGTHNYPGLAALSAAIRYLEREKVSAIAKRTSRQTASIICRMQKIKGVTIYNDCPGVPIVSFNIAGLSNDDAGFILARRYNIVTRTGLHCAPLVHHQIDGGTGCIRASLSSFTTDEECTAFTDAVEEIAYHADSAVTST